MSATSSLQTLDLEKSNSGMRRPPASPPYAFDGPKDDDYFGQQEDVSDMKVGVTEWTLLLLNYH